MAASHSRAEGRLAAIIALMPLVPCTSTSGIDSLQLGKYFSVRGSLDCSSVNVIYVISCLKCGVQGVGECGSPLQRLPSYIAALELGVLGPNPCAIHRHFTDEPHSLADLKILLVDALPVSLSAHPSLVRPP